MKHFTIHASKNGQTEIDIFGQIGDSFFEEGNTLENIKAQIENIETDLVVNVASLGGDVFEGLAIHDLIKNHKAKTITNIVGTTASAGAVIADGSDEVNITENSLFLVHNSRGGVLGTAKDMEDMAGDMKKIDNRMVAIFAKKTGKTEKKIRDLMDEDKFLDAKEAVNEWGFADSIIKPKKIDAIIDYDKIMASKDLTNDQKEKLKPKTSNIMNLAPITNLISELKDTVTNFINSNKEKEVKILDNKEYQDKITEIESSIKEVTDENDTLSSDNEILKGEKTTFEGKKVVLDEEITTLKADAEKFENEKKELSDEIDRLKGTQTKTQTGGDPPDPIEKNKKQSSGMGAWIKHRAKTG